MAGGASGGLLFDASPFDLVVLMGAAGVLLAVGLIACAWPARRATRVSPSEALRAE